jgi:hypothetical protein
MQFVGKKPMPVTELEQRARTPTNLDGMRDQPAVRDPLLAGYRP